MLKMSRRPVSVDKESIHQAYEDVRNDNSDTNWMICGYDADNNIRHDKSGVEMEELSSYLLDDIRLYIFFRLVTGDELSKRVKFGFLSWCGPEVSAMNRARMSTEVSQVKEVIQNFAVERTLTDKSEFDVEYLRTLIINAGGAAYGSAS